MKSTRTRLARLRKSALPMCRVNRRENNVNALDRLLEDSDEGSFSSASSVSSDSQLSYQESEEDSQDSDSVQPSTHINVGKEDVENDETCAVTCRIRKRSARILDDNSDTGCSSDSDIGTEPVRKVKQKKRFKISDSEDETNAKKEHEAEVKKAAAAKRNERKSKLIELLKKRKKPPTRRRRRTEDSDQEEDDVEGNKDKKEAESSKSSSEEETVNLIRSSEEENRTDSDSLKDFIVEDESKEEEEGNSNAQDKNFLLHLPRQFITGSQFTHFQVVVKALLINTLDTSFLQSLYNGKRTKRYAQEMKISLHHFDERLVLPRLENLKQRSRWKDRYKERVECYPKVKINMINSRSKSCEACELHRHVRFCVRLTGQLYHSQTLQEDTFLPNDQQTFFVGSVCARRTQVYHALKHFKYNLFQRCGTALEKERDTELETQERNNDEPVKDTVNRVFLKLMEKGWITQQYEEFEEHQNDVDYFQEEKLD